jgi:8-oxo-dGTP pyrophosphatase MutT (NUDIX family)
MRRFVAVGFLYNPERKEVLLQHRDENTPDGPNQWALFGGWGRDHEEPAQSFVRELKEELEIEVLQRELSLVTSYFYAEKNIDRYVYFIVSRLDKEQMTLNEGRGFAWVPLNEVLDYDLTEQARHDLKKFMEINN